MKTEERPNKLGPVSCLLQIKKPEKEGICLICMSADTSADMQQLIQVISAKKKKNETLSLDQAFSSSQQRLSVDPSRKSISDSVGNTHVRTFNLRFYESVLKEPLKHQQRLSVAPARSTISDSVGNCNVRNFIFPSRRVIQQQLFKASTTFVVVTFPTLS